MILGILVVLLVAYFANKAIQDARNHATAGPRTKGQRVRAAGPRPVSTSSGVTAVRQIGRGVSNAAAIPGALVTGIVEQHRHNRVNGTATTAGGTATQAPPRRTIRQRLRLAPYAPPPPSPENGGSNGNGSTPGGRHCAMCPRPLPDDYEGAICPQCRADQRNRSTAAGGKGSPPASPSPEPPPAQPGSNGGNTVPAASTAAAQKMIEGINEIQSHAATGGIHAKREALAAIHEGATRFSTMVLMLARQMSEPDMNYGHEITEPLATAGQHLTAAAMSVSEADTAIEFLINMTVGDLAKSPRRAPHHRELSENGAR